jgi:hypothetical protein
MSLRKDLKNIKTINVAERKLYSLVPSNVLSLIRCELGCYHNILDSPSFGGRERQALEDLNEEYSQFEDPRVRALLSLNAEHLMHGYGYKLQLSLISELPLNLLLDWPQMHGTISAMPEEVVKILKQNSLLTSKYVAYIWENYKLTRSQLQSLHGPHPVLVIAEGFLLDESIPVIERLKLCYLLKRSRQLSFGGTKPFQLIAMEQEIVAKYKEEYNILNVPDSWVEEMFQ